MKTALVTGAYGYLGSLIRTRLEADGWTTAALVRRPRPGDRAHAWALGQLPDREVLEGVDALVHCAYDFEPRSVERIWEVNVAGSEQLLRAAHAAGIPRLLYLSSMSAYSGTAQAYGRGKLAVEAVVAQLGGVSVRPGLVYGDHPAGMAGALMKVAKMPMIPVIGGASARQFPVHEVDLADAICHILNDESWTSEVFGIAQLSSVGFRELMATFATVRGNRRPVFVRVPWRLIYWSLRAAETFNIALPLRSDSVLGLVRPAETVPESAALPDLLSGLRPFK